VARTALPALLLASLLTFASPASLLPCPWQRLVYEDTEGDEVEDLACLLALVKQEHPEVTAVSSGAIASGTQLTVQLMKESSDSVWVCRHR